MLRFIGFTVPTVHVITALDVYGHDKYYKSLYNNMRFGGLEGGCFRNCIHLKKRTTSKIWKTCVQINHRHCLPLTDMDDMTSYMPIRTGSKCLAYKVMDSTSCSLGYGLDLGLLTDRINTTLPEFTASFIQAGNNRTSMTVTCTNPIRRVVYILSWTGQHWTCIDTTHMLTHNNTITVHQTGMVVSSLYDKPTFNTLCTFIHANQSTHI